MDWLKMLNFLSKLMGCLLVFSVMLNSTGGRLARIVVRRAKSTNS